MYENLENLKLKSRDQNYHQWQSSILITYPPVLRDHFTALPLVEFLVK